MRHELFAGCDWRTDEADLSSPALSFSSPLGKNMKNRGRVVPSNLVLPLHILLTFNENVDGSNISSFSPNPSETGGDVAPLSSSLLSSLSVPKKAW